jgi:peptidoglycan-associated lipoprotein
MKKQWLAVCMGALLVGGCSTSNQIEEDSNDVEVVKGSGAKIESVALDGTSGVESYGVTGSQGLSGQALDGQSLGRDSLGSQQGVMSAEQTPESQGGVLANVMYFGFDQSTLSPENQKIVEGHAAYLKNNSNRLLVLEGHADERGSREYNMALGERRAKSVEELLALLGVNTQQISVVSYGEESPANEGHDEAAWSKNRRVEFKYR